MERKQTSVVHVRSTFSVVLLGPVIPEASQCQAACVAGFPGRSWHSCNTRTSACYVHLQRSMLLQIPYRFLDWKSPWVAIGQSWETREEAIPKPVCVLNMRLQSSDEFLQNLCNDMASSLLWCDQHFIACVHFVWYNRTYFCKNKMLVTNHTIQYFTCDSLFVLLINFKDVYCILTPGYLGLFCSFCFILFWNTTWSTAGERSRTYKWMVDYNKTPGCALKFTNLVGGVALSQCDTRLSYKQTKDTFCCLFWSRHCRLATSHATLLCLCVQTK